MKKNFFLLVLFLTILQTNAQQSLYTLTTTTATYSDLENAALINDGLAWEGIYFDIIPIPFDFKIAEQNISNIGFNDGLFFFFTDMNILASSVSGIIHKDKATSSDISLSPVSYKVEGAVGNRILKIEMKNAGSLTEWEEMNTDNLFVNFQIWIYEGTNIMEYRYGNSNITSSDMTLFQQENPLLLGIISDGYSCFVYENLANPSFVELSGEADLLPYRITSYPVSGTVYRFTPNTTASTDEFNKTQFSLYPNPVAEVLTVSLKKLDVSEYTITDMMGKILLKGNFTAVENTLEIGNLSSGMYFLTIGTTTKKFIKK